MEFKNAEQVQQICWQMRCADYPRDVNRTRINDLNNGVPPYSPEEALTNNINVNCNFLESTRILHDARMQAAQGLLKPGNYFEGHTDGGPASKRSTWNTVFTDAINGPMKRSLDYYEALRSKIALDVLHGIAPSCWENDDRWCPIALGVEDLLIPAQTYLTFKNLPFFCILRSYTAPELMKLARGPNRDPAWNEVLVDQCLDWIDRESMALLGSNWPEIWSPSKTHERVKGDGGVYMGDSVPTISVFDFYYWSDQNKQDGWRRRIVLDDWSTPASMGAGYQFSRNSSIDFGRNQWLYNPGARVFADKREHIFTCNFADLSSVGPFRYHSVRSLGYLLYSVCHLQNRLRSGFNEAVFESLLMYFRVSNADEAERVIKLELARRGIIDNSVTFITDQERYKVNEALVQLGLGENQRMMSENASSWTQNTNYSQDKVEKTKFQVMAEVNAGQALVSSALQQLYTYQTVEYREIVRRFLKKDSTDIEVLQAQKKMKRYIPDKYLVPEAWEIDATRVLGAGNKTMEMAQAEQLMQFRPLYDPPAQRQILRDVTLAITDDPAKAQTYVPDEPVVSDSVHDTQLAFGALMIGGQVSPRPGLNNIEVAGTMIQLMTGKVQEIMQGGAVGTPEQVKGLVACAQYAAGFIELLKQDPEQKQAANQIMQALSNIMNEVKGMMQRQQEMAQKAAQNGQGGSDPEAMAKIQAIMMQAQIKAKTQAESHAQKTAQRQITFEQKTRQDQAKTAQELQLEQARTALELQKEAAKSGIELKGRAATHAIDLGHQDAAARLDIEATRKKNAEQGPTEE